MLGWVSKREGDHATGGVVCKRAVGMPAGWVSKTEGGHVRGWGQVSKRGYAWGVSKKEGGYPRGKVGIQGGGWASKREVDIPGGG